MLFVSRCVVYKYILFFIIVDARFSFMVQDRWEKFSVYDLLKKSCNFVVSWELSERRAVLLNGILQHFVYFITQQK